MQSGRNPPQIRPSLNRNMSESQCFCIFQEPLNRDKYAYTGLSAKYDLGKSSYVSKISPVQAKNQIITVSVFLSTLQLTALLLINFPPPPPLLHPNIYIYIYIYIYICVYISLVVPNRCEAILVKHPEPILVACIVRNLHQKLLEGGFLTLCPPFCLL